MTVIVRDNPLLSIPKQVTNGWWSMTPGDNSSVSKEFEERKKEGYETSDFIELVYFMRKLGLSPDYQPREGLLEAKILHYHSLVKSRPVDLSKDKLDTSTSNTLNTAGRMIAWTFYQMKEHGQPFNLTPNDKKAMMDALTINRGINWGSLIADLHHNMAEIGFPQQITEEDVKSMKDELDDHRTKKKGEGSGEGIAKMHYFLTVLGKPQEITQQDLRAMRKQLDEYRKEGKGSSIAKMEYWLSQIFHHPDTGVNMQMPPIKKIGGGIG